MQQRLELGQPCSGFATAEDGFTEQIDVRIPPGASLLGEVAFGLPVRPDDEMTDDAPHTSMGERHDEAWDDRSQPRAGGGEDGRSGRGSRAGGGCVDQRAELPSGNEVVVWSSDPINERHDEVDAGVVRHDAVEALHRLSGPSGLERLGAVEPETDQRDRFINGTFCIVGGGVRSRAVFDGGWQGSM